MAKTLVGTALFAWAPFGCLVVGVLYVLTSSAPTPMPSRVLAAAYAPSAALIYVAVAVLSGGNRTEYIAPLFPLLLLIPAALLIWSVFRFSGPRWVHLVLVPVAVLCMAWQSIWGYFAIYGK